MIKFVMYSLPGKIMFSTLFCRHSSAFDRATVSLECQSRQRRNAGMDLDVLRCRNKQSIDGLENAPKYAFWDPKMKKNSGEGDIPSPYLTPVYSRRLRRSTWPPPNPNPGSKSWIQILDPNPGSGPGCYDCMNYLSVGIVCLLVTCVYLLPVVFIRY